MGEIRACPICFKVHEIAGFQDGDGYFCNNRQYNCLIGKDVVRNCSDEEKEKRFNIIYNFVFNKPYYNTHERKYWKFFYAEDEAPSKNEYINVYHSMQNYPNNLVERVDAILLNLEKLNPKFFSKFDLYDLINTYPRLFYPDLLKKSADIVIHYQNIKKLLYKLKFIEIHGAWQYSSSQPKQKDCIELTYEAWQRIDSLNKQNKTSKDIFIAMSFKADLAEIEKTFKDGIKEAGFNPIIIKDVEHNNYIMPEIFHYIQNSAGVVVDITKPNYGAYFEAGCAMGKNKPVIFCCSRETFNNDRKKPHFDVAQLSTIIWDNLEDLKKRLVARIKATIE